MPPVIPINAIHHMLQKTFHRSNWVISKPPYGQQKECYIAKTDELAAFLKFDNDCSLEVLQRLGDLGVTPRILSTGNIEERQYILQEYLTGQHPGWRWFADHLPMLARVTQRYHTDHQLKQLLAGPTSIDYGEQIESELARLELQMISLKVGTALASTLSTVFAELKRQTSQFHPVPLAPVHNDPNGANIFLTGDTFVLVDWDEILLADPMRDVSQWLGWYVPQEHWSVFAKEHNLRLDQSLYSRISGGLHEHHSPMCYGTSNATTTTKCF
jgi:aminoglycoside phosphotransferase (APT) family kinase protein